LNVQSLVIAISFWRPRDAGLRVEAEEARREFLVALD
jgi:hypothetical protein